MVSVGLTEMVAFDQSLEGGKEVNLVDIWEKSILGRGNSQRQGSKVGARLAYLKERSSREASVGE